MQNMTNEKVMQILTDMGVHEGGMDNWVADNAWVKFAALVASAEREACAKVCEDSVEYAGDTLAESIRARGNTQ
jgi:hypothetical protein